MNSCVIYGRLGGDSEVIYTNGGKPMLKFSVANNTGYGEKKLTHWFNCVKFGESAVKLQQYLIKGAAVVVQGEVSMNTWKSQEGVEHSKLSLNVREVSLVGSKSDGESRDSRTSRPAAQETQQLDFDDSDIPF